MKQRVLDLLQRGDKLFADRFPLLTLWQTFAENFYPIRADFTRMRYISEEFASYLMTGRPVLAHRELTNALSTILRPRGMQWKKAQTNNENVNKDRSSAEWLKNADDGMNRLFNSRQSHFERATKEADGDFVLTGQAVIEPRVNKRRNGMIFRCWHLRDCVWAESDELDINYFDRKWTPHARQLIKAADDYGWTQKLSPKVAERAKQDPFSPIKCRAITLPADEYDSYGTTEDGDKRRYNANFPFVRVVLDEDNQTVLEETPQRKLGYVIPRWVTIGGFSQYAYSPTAIVALPDGRMLQQMTLTLAEIGSKVLDPPMKAVGDAIQGGVNLFNGAITWVDPDYDERTGSVLEPIELHPEGLQWGVDYQEKLEAVISEAFFLNVLNLPPMERGEKATAFEISERIKEYVRRATPLFSPMRSEYNGALCEDVFDTMFYNGAFGSPLDMPPALRGSSIEFTFRDPLAVAEEEQTTQAFQNLLALLQAGQATGLDDLGADVDVDVAFRDAVPGTGAKPTWIRAVEEANQIKAQNRQRKEQISAMEQLGHAGDQVGKAAGAIKTIGEAGQSIRDAGVTAS